MPTMLFTALQKYAQFSGRARRKEYWQFILLNVIVSVIAGILDSILGTAGAASGTGVIGGLASLALLVPGLAVAWRRMHDVEKPGYLSLLPLLGVIPLGLSLGSMPSGPVPSGPGPLLWVGVAVMVATTIYLLTLYLKEGTRGPNEYGPDPKGFGGEALRETFR